MGGRIGICLGEVRGRGQRGISNICAQNGLTNNKRQACLSVKLNLAWHHTFGQSFGPVVFIGDLVFLFILSVFTKGGGGGGGFVRSLADPP